MRTTRILDVANSPGVLFVLARLCRGPASQHELLKLARMDPATTITQPTLSKAFVRLQDLGLLTRGRDGFSLTYPAQTERLIEAVVELAKTAREADVRLERLLLDALPDQSSLEPNGPPI